jgi:N-acetylneuraminic acid mutarotase
MKKILLILSAVLVFTQMQAQNAWRQKADFGGTALAQATVFSIGNKGYIGTGYNVDDRSYKKDFWEYDPATNAWTQKADFHGTARNGATGFSIGSKGYMGTGNESGSYKNDFWEYNPAINQWRRIADFPGTARDNATGFSIGSKGYIGTGISSGSINKRDFWEYDPATNQWTQKADFGGTARYLATGFGIGSKGYIGTGISSGYPSGSLKRDFWEYDPATDQWTQKADFGGTARNLSTGFSIGSKGYIGTGFDGRGVKNDFWNYDPATDAWTQKAGFGGTARRRAIGFSIGSKGYIGMGEGADGSNKKDFWEYDPAPTTLLSASYFCPGYPVTVQFFTDGTYNTGNTFTAQLSDASGRFASPAVIIGSISSTTSGTINAVIPASTPAGTAYRIRVISSDPVFTGPDNGTDLTVTAPHTYYVDADHDGFGSTTTAMLCSPTALDGYATNNTDCDDGSLLYADSDGDGFGAGDPVACGVANNTDCDDARLLYADSDGDGFGAGAAAACGVANNTDCNDGNGAINPTTVWYLDADNDGYYTGSGITQCASPGAGYKSTGLTSEGDCDDASLLYADSDGDGFGAGDPAALWRGQQYGLR